MVYRELQHPATPPSVRTALKPPPAWLNVIPTGVTEEDPVLLTLDKGEKAALILGLRLGASLALIDERKGAAVALRMGFSFKETLAS